MIITKEIVSAELKDVDRFARESFEGQGYEVRGPVQSIVDLGHNGRYRSWSVTVEAFPKVSS